MSPSGSIVPTPTTIAAKPPLIDFDVLQEYIIPRKAFFNRFLTVQDPEGRYSVLGFPVLIPDAKYQRNEFIFNFGLVLDADAEQAPYERVRLLAAGLVPLTLTPFAAGSLNPTLDAILCAGLILHSHLGFQAIIVDYVPAKRFPKSRKGISWGLNAATALVGLGLYEFETND
ncbi:hypothetical protein BN1708_016954, partial [Verticillium longisporum]